LEAKIKATFQIKEVSKTNKDFKTTKKASKIINKTHKKHNKLTQMSLKTTNKDLTKGGPESVILVQIAIGPTVNSSTHRSRTRSVLLPFNFMKISAMAIVDISIWLS
jgi:hypothetical protein